MDDHYSKLSRVIGSTVTCPCICKNSVLPTLICFSYIHPCRGGNHGEVRNLSLRVYVAG